MKEGDEWIEVDLELSPVVRYGSALREQAYPFLTPLPNSCLPSIEFAHCRHWLMEGGLTAREVADLGDQLYFQLTDLKTLWEWAEETEESRAEMIKEGVAVQRTYSREWGKLLDRASEPLMGVFKEHAYTTLPFCIR